MKIVFKGNFGFRETKAAMYWMLGLLEDKLDDCWYDYKDVHSVKDVNSVGVEIDGVFYAANDTFRNNRKGFADMIRNCKMAA